MLAGCVVVGVAVLLGVRAATQPKFTLDDYPQVVCSAPPLSSGTGRVFHVDPARGSPDGDGSRERPWHSLQFLVAQGLLGEYQRTLTWPQRVVARLSHRPATPQLAKRAAVRVRSGDTILLASGDYGLVDLSGLVNRGLVTIAAAPGAQPQLAGLDAGGASHFVLRDLGVTAVTWPAGRAHLVSMRSAKALRADNLVFERIAVSGGRAIASVDPADFAVNAPSGVRLDGDCLTFKSSEVRDVESGIRVVRGRSITIEGNMIHDFSVDGIQFSGNDLTIRGNRIFDHWRTANTLHPDCMQGQPQDNQIFGPVLISHNACISRLAHTEARPEKWQAIAMGGWQGISIFDGRWRDVTVRCNLVMPSNPHGIALYGATASAVEHNVVVGTPRNRLSWIAIMPSKEGRPPEQVAVQGNWATGYLNAVQGGVIDPLAMIAYLRVNKRDTGLRDVLMQPIAGVAMADNTWLVPADQGEAISADNRFDWQSIPPVNPPASIAEALGRYALPAECAAAS